MYESIMDRNVIFLVLMPANCLVFVNAKGSVLLLVSDRMEQKIWYCQAGFFLNFKELELFISCSFCKTLAFFNSLMIGKLRS